MVEEDHFTLPPEPTTVGRARLAVRKALDSVADPRLVDAAEIAVSELVTNAVMHACTVVDLRIIAEAEGLRVEIEDGSAQLPVRRTRTDVTGTGRGLLIVEEHVDRWDAVRTERGKVVWFELGELTAAPPSAVSTLGMPPPVADAIEVSLLDVPLLMHWAWQEHASTLLREFLLYTLDEDPYALDHHAAASDALSILNEQVPAPELPTEPGALMASSVEPMVTADELTLRVPEASLHHFQVVNDLLAKAIAAARDGQLLGPPTSPEISEMREWLCGEVLGQARGAPPKPWRALTDVRSKLEPASWRSQRDLTDTSEPLIATNEAGVIVAVTHSVVEFLGYGDESGLVGRRILVVIPVRFHQAHIAGTTLHVTNGRDALLNRWIDVPIIRSDNNEVMVGLRVERQRDETDVVLFVARLLLPQNA